SVAPAAKAPKMSNTDRSKCSGEWPESLSSGPRPKYPFAHSTKWITLAWVITTPLGAPVDPEVKRMCAGSWLLVAHASHPEGCVSISADVREGVKRLPSAGARPSQPTARPGTA